MGHCNIPPEKRFQPGQSGNPSGRPKGMLTRDQVSAVMARFSKMHVDEVVRIATDPKSTMLDATMASIYLRAHKEGDYARMQFLLDRSIGRVKDVAEVELTQKTVSDEDLKKANRDELIKIARGA